MAAAIEAKHLTTGEHLQRMTYYAGPPCDDDGGRSKVARIYLPEAYYGNHW